MRGPRDPGKANDYSWHPRISKVPNLNCAVKIRGLISIFEKMQLHKTFLLKIPVLILNRKK